jgi:hypothetical protein
MANIPVEQALDQVRLLKSRLQFLSGVQIVAERASNGRFRASGGLLACESAVMRQAPKGFSTASSVL